MCDQLINLIIRLIPWGILITCFIFLIPLIHQVTTDQQISNLWKGQQIQDIRQRFQQGDFKLKLTLTLVTIGLAIIPILIFFVNKPAIDQAVIDKLHDDLNFTVIAVALATYVATVRLYLIGRLSTNSSKLIKTIIVTMIPADFNLILSAFLSLYYYLFDSVLSKDDPTHLMNLSIIAFFYAVAYLAVQHIFAWIINFYKLIGY